MSLSFFHLQGAGYVVLHSSGKFIHAVMDLNLRYKYIQKKLLPVPLVLTLVAVITFLFCFLIIYVKYFAYH